MKTLTIIPRGPGTCSLFDGEQYVADHIPDALAPLLCAAPAMLAALRRIAENGAALSGEECAEIAASAYTTDMYEGR